ncbi:MAG: prolyl oligopeptidase family serine peptidase [Planctomycetaceae bacterium]
MIGIQRAFLCCGCVGLMLAGTTSVQAQTAFPSAKSLKISEQDRQTITKKLGQLRKAITVLKSQKKMDRQLIADVDVFAKAAEWILRHGEFFRKNYARLTISALDTGLKRALELSEGKPSWTHRPGTSIRGYYSKVDGSVQPYALTLPKGVQPDSPNRWPLHVKLHGRGSTLNEVSFISRHEGKPLPKGQNWVQVDVFGRTNNAYRWSGETDIFEAMADLRRTVRVDNLRITLHGFSMGGAGAWHLGLHYPSKWSSVGPGAGFVDFYEYQNQKQKRPLHEHLTLGIYDAVDYVLNAANVPVCTYGGEKDKQLLASTRMVDEAKKLGVKIKLVIGKGAGHRFTPEGFKEFMAFHLEKSKQGRLPFPGLDSIRFTTRTLKYNQCEWLTIEEMLELYKPAVVEGGVDKNGVLRLKTKNVAVLQIARDIADTVEIDGTLLKLRDAAQGLLPGVYYEKGKRQWYAQTYNESKKFLQNPDLRKRHNLQGPIDDAFMQPFVCVRGTGTPWNEAQSDWANWTLKRFDREFDKWLRGKIPIVDDSAITDAHIASKNLILFGDPGSNSLIAKVLEKLPIQWTKKEIIVHGKSYDPATHGISLIYPNPLNPRRYVVINSGHTFHERDFRASNSWLFPRLGDIAVQKFKKSQKGGYEESVVWATIFNPSWKFAE